MFYDVSTVFPWCEYIIEYHLDSLTYLAFDSDSLIVQHFTAFLPWDNLDYPRKFVERIGNSSRFEVAGNHDYCSTDPVGTYLCSFNDSNAFVSSDWEFSCSDIISTIEEKIDHLDQFKVFPNPTSDIVSVESDNNIQSIRVKDIHGNDLLKSMNSDTVDINSLPNGIYFLLVSFNSQISFFRIVKQ